jgi:serine/threonine protein kinase
MTDEDELRRIARAIDEQARVDWDATSAAASNESMRRTIRELALIGAIAQAHQDLPQAAPAAQPAWGTFRLIAKVGQGAYGEVYRAWDTRLDREVALKLLPAAPEHSQRDTSIIEEGRLLARVRHPNVVTLYGAERIDGRVGLWMEFVTGRTLEEMLEKGPFDEIDAVSIGIELCRAVSAVHGVGLLHRDIKAQNVMRAEDGRIALMDFGTGRVVGDDETALDLAGTPLYLAPEVLAGGAATRQSDLYAVGVLLYHLLTGSYPVRGKTLGDLRRAHRAGERTPIESCRTGLSDELTSLMARVTDARPDARHSSADELEQDLRSLKSTSPASLAAKAFRLIDRRGLPNVQQATELFRRAVAKNSAFAPAHAGLTSAYAFSSFPYRGLSYDEAYPIMKCAAERAAELDSSLAETHAALGWVYSFEHEWAKADLAFQQAMRLNPGLMQVYTSYSISTLQPLRRYAEGLKLLDGAAKLDPLSLDIQRERGELELYAGQYAEAVETFQRVYETEPDFPFVQAYLAKALTFAGRPAEALPLLEPGDPWLAQGYVMTGCRAEAEKLADEWVRYPYRYAVIKGALGDAEAAIDALERAAREGPQRFGRLLNEPELDVVHGHPRVAALRKAFGLP